MKTPKNNKNLKPRLISDKYAKEQQNKQKHTNTEKNANLAKQFNSTKKQGNTPKLL